MVAVFTADDLNDKVAVSMLPSMFQGADDFMAPIFPSPRTTCASSATRSC